ncbi:TIGR04197 family type VII secretion effector [Furfurilactobacillus sp. WILCCON 0119]
MGKISINVGNFNSNVSSVRNAVSSASGEKLSRIQLKQTSASPFTRLADSSSEIGGLISKMNSLLNQDVSNFSRVPSEIQKADNKAYK